MRYLSSELFSGHCAYMCRVQLIQASHVLKHAQDSAQNLFFSETGILFRKIRVVPIEQLCEVCHVLYLKCTLICQLPCVFFGGVLHCYIQTNLLINQLSDNRRKAEKSKNELGLKLI